MQPAPRPAPWLTLSALLFGAAAAVMTVSPALAQSSAERTLRHDVRQEAQAARIDRGTTRGTLTERETARLEAGQERVARGESRAEADGVVTAREKAVLERRQDRQSRLIRRNQHDAQQR